MFGETQVGRRLKLVHIADRGASVVRLHGEADESLDARRLARTDYRDAVIFDLEGLEAVDGAGLAQLSSAFSMVTQSFFCLANVRTPLAAKLSQSPQLLGRGEFVSLFAPFACETCGARFEQRLDARRDLPTLAKERPTVACTSCGADAEFQGPAHLFDLMKARPAPAPPPAVSALLDRPPPPGGWFRIEQDITDEVTALWLSGPLNRTASFKRVADGLEGRALMVLGQLTGWDEQGIERLAAFVATPELEVVLAQVPLAVAVHPLLERARVVSVRLGGFCPTCERNVQVVLEAAEFEEALEGATPQCPCPLCGALASASAFDLAEARNAPWSEPAREIEAYLVKRAGDAAVEAKAPGPPSKVQEFGDYELVRKIGKGGMAELFLARRKGPMGFEKQVALKRILPELSADPNLVELFLKEARVAAEITHPNVVQIFDLGQLGEHFFIAMEYVRGWDLNIILRLAKKLGVQLPWALACRIVAGVCAGLHAAHSCPQPIVHRDVSPHNVLVGLSGVVKLTDFGIAKVLGAESHTRPGTLVGKVSYAAPEHVQHLPDLDARIDVFAAGVVLAQSLTLEHPFRRENEIATLNAIVNDPLPDLRVKRPDAPGALTGILEKALARDRDQRCRTALELSQALEAVLSESGEPSGAPELAAWLEGLIARAR